MTFNDRYLDSPEAEIDLNDYEDIDAEISPERVGIKYKGPDNEFCGDDCPHYTDGWGFIGNCNIYGTIHNRCRHNDCRSDEI